MTDWKAPEHEWTPKRMWHEIGFIDEEIDYLKNIWIPNAKNNCERIRYKLRLMNVKINQRGLQERINKLDDGWGFEKVGVR